MMSLADDANEAFGKRVYRFMNGYSGPSGVAAYKEALGQVLTELTVELRARRQKLGLEKSPATKLLLMTLPPLGEVLGDRHNTRIDQYNTALREVVAAHAKQEAAKAEADPALSVEVVELHRACADAIEAADAKRTAGVAKARGVGVTVFYAMCDIIVCDVRKNVWGLGYDRQSQDAGLAVLCPDRIHLNNAGATLLVGLVGPHLRGLVPKE
ncbi:hypothetical protein HYH03_006755 [Edaphochlamys debaryana]|uniref:SGNH hydrolase-type esterase domain-containing protein n=1 Tax=Edaphochlamys debaryana TaxID=47281 RepID=A0A836C0R1_9CHLO|nr:hypothetical protein HYH03_006755 [Edaphochlamys debaryana]|eukprot:KAG2495147.1 hypothetical protein HYH03_006755 [Edaphochlamys debaryana]